MMNITPTDLARLGDVVVSSPDGTVPVAEAIASVFSKYWLEGAAEADVIKVEVDDKDYFVRHDKRT